MSILLSFANLPACEEALETRLGYASAARPQGAARNPAQIVRCAPDWWRLPRSSLDPSSLRRGFAGSKAKAAAGAAKALPAGARGFGHGARRETEMQELMPKGVAATVPPLCATEDEADPVARVKLFSCMSGWTWYVTEYDPATGEAFGLVEGFADEWGYFSIREMGAANRSHGLNVVERDVLFEPAPVSRVRR